MDDLESRVIDVIALELATRPARLTRSTEFLEDLQLDSLEVASLSMAIEEEFSIAVADDALGDIVTIGDAIAYVESALQARPPLWPQRSHTQTRP
jgi:acyl carrier protein